MKTLSILGAGGHGVVAAEIAEELGWQVSFYDNRFPKSKVAGEWKIVGDEKALFNLNYKETSVFVAIGNNRVRETKCKEIQNQNFNLVSLLSPKSSVSQYTEIGRGVLICKGACVNVGSRVQDGAIINTAAVVDHDCHIGAFAHISPNASLAGNVHIDERVWVGIGSSIVQQVRIGRDVVVGAGAVVIIDVAESNTVVGCPAKPIDS